MKAALDEWDIARARAAVQTFYKARPGGIPTQVAFSQVSRWPSLDTDRAEGCIRPSNMPSRARGLAVLRGNIARDGCVVKTAAWTTACWSSRARPMVESQDEAVEHILGDKVKAGDVVVVRYEGPKGGPGMQEMLYPTSYIKSKGLGQGLRAADRRPLLGGTSGLSIGHCSPEAAAGGAIGLLRNGDRIRIDIPKRSIDVLVDDAELARAAASRDALGWKPAQPAAQGVGGAEGLCPARHQRGQGRGARPLKLDG